jgi:hypothetical protein
MATGIVVVEYYHRTDDCTSKVVFKAFESISVFEDFCTKNRIQILKGAFGSTYYDDEYCYVVTHTEFIK